MMAVADEGLNVETLFEPWLAIGDRMSGDRLSWSRFLAAIPTSLNESPRLFAASAVDHILPSTHFMWAQIATTLAPYGLPVLAMLGGYLVVYKLVEKTAVAILKLEPKPKTRPRL